MKKFILSLIEITGNIINKMIQKTLVVICLCAFATGVAAQSDSRFFTGGISDIHPKGWLETMLKRQHDGLTGHPEALSYPFNSCLWAGEISCPDESYGENWWRYEQTAYYTEGLLSGTGTSP